MSDDNQTPEVLIILPHDEEALNAHIEDGQSKISAAIENKEALTKLVGSFMEITVESIKDLPQYNHMKDGLKKLKKLDKAIEDKRKELTAPALKYQRDLKAHADELRAIIAPGKEHVAKQIQAFEDAEKAEQERVFRERCTTLTENGYQLIGENYVSGVNFLDAEKIKGFNDDEFNFYVDLGKKEVERAKAEEKRKADQEAAIVKEREEMAAEREAMAAEREEMRKMMAELEAQKAALDEQYNQEKPAEEEEQPAPEEAKAPEAPAKEDAANILDGGDPKEEKAAEPADQDPAEAQAEEPTAETEEAQPSEEQIDAYRAGFYAFRDRLIVAMGDETQKRNRLGWSNWAKAQATGDITAEDVKFQKQIPAPAEEEPTAENPQGNE